MGTSPITIGVGNGAAIGPLLLTPAQRVAPPAQDQPRRARQAEFVICDQAIERLVGKLKQFRRVATRYEKLAAHYLAFVQLAAAMVWLRAVGSRA
jgi:transposase